MKRRLITTALLGMLGGTTALTSSPVHANNISVESALASYGDISTFYAALLNTGVLNELDPNTNYTIFAPTNAAFAEIQPNAYPCFYSAQCRAQVADVLRNHIVVGRKTLNELTREAEVPTIGHYRVYAGSPYVGDYAIANHKVLSEAEVRGNMIDRIDGVIVARPQVAQFRTMPPVAGNVTQERTITTYRTPAAYPVPGGGYPVGASETVSERTYVAPGSSSATAYPDGTQTTTTQRTYMTPDGNNQSTTVTRSVTSQP